MSSLNQNNTTNTPFFSIVCPAYKSGPYLKDLINAINESTLEDFELLLMIEESPDDALAQATKAAQDDSRIKVFSLPKTGSASASRNRGVEVAKGEFILFVDGDDWFTKDTMQVVYDKIQADTSVEMVMFAGCMYMQDQNKELKFITNMFNLHESEAPGIIDGTELLSKLHLLERGAQIIVMINAYRRDFLLNNKLFFVEGLRFEDQEWTVKENCNYR